MLDSVLVEGAKLSTDKERAAKKSSASLISQQPKLWWHVFWPQ